MRIRPVSKVITCITCKGTGLVRLWNNTKAACRDCKPTVK